LNREGSKYAKGYIFFMIRTDDHEKRNAIQNYKSIVIAATRRSQCVFLGVLCVLSAAGGWCVLEPRLNSPPGLNWVNREGAKDAKGYIFFMIRTDDHEKRNAIQNCKSIVIAVTRRSQCVFLSVPCVLSAAGGWCVLEPRLNSPPGLNWVNREGAKDAKGFIFFMIRTDDHEKRNALQNCKSIVAAATRRSQCVFLSVPCVLSAAGGWCVLEPRRRPGTIFRTYPGGMDRRFHRAGGAGADYTD
jgi:hypothetical protein